MLFQTQTFFIFFIIVYSLYLCFYRKYSIQNFILLAASYVFYGWWDWRFLSLLWISTVMDYICAILIENASDLRKKKRILILSLTGNLGILGIFKYLNFFSLSLHTLLNSVGLDVPLPVLNAVLPVGISFYTFQTMSYTLDVYRGQFKASRNFSEFALFVSFFPHLVAGPLLRAPNLLKQIQGPRQITLRHYDEALFLLLWGYFQKVVIADNVSVIVNQVFQNSGAYGGLDIGLAVLAFAVQIYCDFSGYSNIARGLAKLLGFELSINFNIPYAARNPSEFWSRWHITLSSWFRDYLYIPIGGNRGTLFQTCRNLMITMLLAGLWHGARWTFVMWGIYHGFLLLIYHAWRQRFPQKILPDFLQRVFMFVLVCFGWLLFRSQSLTQAGQMIGQLGISTSLFTASFLKDLLFFTAPLVLIEFYQKKHEEPLWWSWQSNRVRIPLYSFFCLWLLIFSVRGKIEFIYFQF